MESRGRTGSTGVEQVLIAEGSYGYVSVRTLNRNERSGRLFPALIRPRFPHSPQ